MTWLAAGMKSNDAAELARCPHTSFERVLRRLSTLAVGPPRITRGYVMTMTRDSIGDGLPAARRGA